MESSTNIKTYNFINSQLFVFIIFLCVFLLAAAFGWEKLQYGFNFVDEGWHMVEGWRLASGDRLFTDKCGEALQLYKIMNASIFKIASGITLLDFRKIQFFLTILSLIILSYALYLADRQYWYQPLVFSCFAFTGLDPIGIISNLNYYTYPHLFLILHVSFLMLGLKQKIIQLKKMLFIVSGIFLWGISLSILHTSIIIFCPILLSIASNKLKFRSLSFPFSDCCYVVAPFIILWALFLAVYNTTYLSSIIASIDTMLKMPGYSSHSLSYVSLHAAIHVAVTLVFLVLCLLGLRKLKTSLSIVWLGLLSISMYFIIETSLFGLMMPYSYPVEWCSRPMWFASLFIAFLIIFWFIMAKRLFTTRKYSEDEAYSLVILMPCTFLGAVMSFFSINGALMFLLCSIPISACIARFVVYQTNASKGIYATKAFILLLIFLPFYSTISWSDWNFSFFDVSPVHQTAKIEDGFGKGIKTNSTYEHLYYWIRSKSMQHSNKNDYILSYIVSPMVYMIAERRPALDDTWVNFDLKPPAYYQENIKRMEASQRNPKLAFVFDSIPGLFPISFRDEKYVWLPKTFSFPSNDPISNYVTKNMTLLDSVTISPQLTVRCFIDYKVK